MRAAGASILRDTSVGLLSSAMVQSSPSLFLCTVRLLYRAHVSGFTRLDVPGPTNSFIGQVHILTDFRYDALMGVPADADAHIDLNEVT